MWYQHSGYSCMYCGAYIQQGVQHKCGPDFRIQTPPIGRPLYDAAYDPIIPPPPHGCICPPGANRECENPTCPRKPPKPPSATGL